ncbi:MAG: hypothetical protein ABSD11_20755, partial [Methylocella sp.]
QWNKEFFLTKQGVYWRNQEIGLATAWNEAPLSDFRARIQNQISDLIQPRHGISRPLPILAVVRPQFHLLPC